MDKLKFSDNFLYKTGERIIPGAVSESALSEHYARYLFALEMCKGKKVLNVACGAGYGSEVLLKVANEVFNVDISEQLVAYGNLRYGNYKNHFVTMDAQKMSFPDQFFDVVVSFETFEHLPKYKKFISECSRVLRPGGALIISMPNKNVTSPGLSTPLNQFHFKEWTLSQFKRLVLKKFKLTGLYGQNLSQPAKYQTFITSNFFRLFSGYAYSKMPASILKLLKHHVFKFKDIPLQNIKLNITHKIKSAKDVDFVPNQKNLAYAIMLIVLKKI